MKRREETEKREQLQKEQAQNISESHWVVKGYENDP